MRTEVYSWRLSEDLKSEVERAARARQEPFSATLERAVRDWLKKSAPEEDEEAKQQRLHAEAESYFGILSGKRRDRSEQVRALVRARLGRRYAR